MEVTHAGRTEVENPGALLPSLSYRAAAAALDDVVEGVGGEGPGNSEPDPSLMGSPNQGVGVRGSGAAGTPGETARRVQNHLGAEVDPLLSPLLLGYA